MDSESFYKHKINNLIHSILIFAGMILLISFLGWSVGGVQGLKWLFVISIFMLIMSPRISPYMVLRLYGARLLHAREVPRLYGALEELTRRANLPNPPRLYYVPSRVLNAFTMGKRNRAAIALTDGLMRALDFRELIGVLAHEISHLGNNDMWIMNMSDVVSRVASVFSLVGQFLLFLNLPLILLYDYKVPWLPILVLIFTPTLTMLLQLALSRTREFDADLEAVNLTGDPEGLASALAKMERHQGGFLGRIFFPGNRNPHPSMLRTHPETEERIKRLLSLVEKRQKHIPIQGFSDEAVFGMPLDFAQVHRKPRWRIGGLWY